MIVYTPDSNKVVHYTCVDLSDRPINKPIHLVQYDNRIPILAVSVYDSGKSYSIPSTAKVNIRFSKPDEKFVYNPALGIKSDNSIIYFEITKQMMSLSGLAKAVVEIEMYDSVACSSPISFIVDRNPIQHHSIESTIEFKTAQQYAKEAESWAHGNTGIREGENTNNSKYWSEQSKDYANSWKGSLLPQGTIRFSQLPTSGNIAGHMYNINEAFVTDSRFKDGAGYSYPAGTNVYWTSDEKWNCLSGTLTMTLTQAEYNNLSNAEKMNGTIYYITDGDNLLTDLKLGNDGKATISYAEYAWDSNKLNGKGYDNFVTSSVYHTDTDLNNPSFDKAYITVSNSVEVVPKTNDSNSGYWHIMFFPYSGSGTQVAMPFSGNKLYMRSANSGKWSDWFNIANGSDSAIYIKLTQAEYNELPSTKNSNNIIYFITD